MDSRIATGKSVRAHHKELIFPVAVREVVTLGTYLAMTRSERCRWHHPLESLFRRLDTRRGWPMGPMAMLVRLLSRKVLLGTTLRHLMTFS